MRILSGPLCINQETCANINKTFPKNLSFLGQDIEIFILDGLKPPGGACAAGMASVAAGTIGAAATAAGTGAAGEGREPRLSKPDSSRSFCTGAGARAMAGAKAGAAAVGARVGDMRPEREIIIIRTLV